MNSSRIILCIAAIAVSVVYVVAEECDPDGKGGCNTYVKSSSGIKVTSDNMKNSRNDYQASKTNTKASGKTSGGSTQVAAKTKSGHAAQSTGGKKNGKAATAQKESRGKKINLGQAGNSKVGHAGKKGSNQVQNIYAKKQGGKSYTGKTKYNDAKVDSVQTQTVEGSAKKNFVAKKSSSGTGQAQSDQSPTKVRMTGLKKGTSAVSGTKFTGANPPRLDSKKFTGTSAKTSSQSKAEYVGPTDFKYLKGRNRLISNQEESGTVSKSQISGGNALLGSIIGDKANVGLTSESNAATNQVKTSSQIFGTNIESGTNAKINSYKEVECSGDFENKDADNGGFKFYKLNSAKLRQQADGSYKFPSCMDIDAKVRIAAGVNLQDVALSMSLTTPTCGQYKCGPTRKCGPIECFYRRLCPKDIPRGDSFNDAGEFLVTSLTESDVCDIPIASSPRDVNIKFKYCPNTQAEVDQDSFCNKNIFGTFGALFGNDKKSSMTIQLDMYVANEPFDCSNLSGPNFYKVACKQFRYDYTIQAAGSLPATGQISGGSKPVDCSSPSNANHPQCVGAHS